MNLHVWQDCYKMYNGEKEMKKKYEVNFYARQRLSVAALTLLGGVGCGHSRGDILCPS